MIRYTPGIEATLNMLSKLGFLFLFLAVAIGAQSDPSLRFRLKYSEAIHNGPITGRAYIMISNNNEKEPRLSVGRSCADTQQLPAGVHGRAFHANAQREP